MMLQARGSLIALTAGFLISGQIPAFSQSLHDAKFRVRQAPPVIGGVVADVIFHNGVVVTMNELQPTAEALAVQDKIILDVGSDAEILAYQGPATIVVDLEGRTLLPGFVDAHTHLLNDAEIHMGMSLVEVQELALQHGITALGDLYVDSGFLATMQALDANELLRIRTSLYLVYTDNCGGIIGDWYRQYPPTTDPWAMLRIAGVKVFVDGGTCGLPAVSFEYPDIGGHGDLFFTQTDLNTAVSMIHDDGYQVVMHAIGDLAIELAQNAIEAALAGGPNALRHRIDHNSFARSDLLPRYGEIGVVASIFGYYPTCAEVNDSALSQFFGMDAVLWLEDWRSFLDAEPEFPIAWHGDDPWVGPISPIEEMYSLVTRKEFDPDSGTVCEPPDWLAEHTITAEEALPLMNINAAYALFREEVLGSLVPQKYADFVVLSDNPLTVGPDMIREIDVLMTVVGGRAEYCAPAEPGLCGAFVQNLALNRPVTASNALPSNPPEMAVDGDLDTPWVSGGHPPQWIEIDLQGPFDVDNIKLVVDQYPTGDTRHWIWGKRTGPGAEYELLHEFDRFTQSGDILSYTPPEPWQDIRWVKVETVESPSWVSWREIEVVRKVTPPVGLEEPWGVDRIPEAIFLGQNSPNPFNPSTTISYELKWDSTVRLEIFNVRGQMVRTFVGDELGAGSYSVTWDGRGENEERVASGIYLYRLTVTTAEGTFEESRKMVAVK